jgi:hypothetical protein
MNSRTITTLLVAALLCLVPSVARANGWNAIEKCINTTPWCAGIGCVVGLIVALSRRASTGKLFSWTIGGGLAFGIVGGLVATAPSSSSFIEVAILSVVLAGVVAGFGGAILSALAWAIRSGNSNKSGLAKPQPPEIKRGEK